VNLGQVGAGGLDSRDIKPGLTPLDFSLMETYSKDNIYFSPLQMLTIYGPELQTLPQKLCDAREGILGWTTVVLRLGVTSDCNSDKFGYTSIHLVFIYR
jgi:hypothetical protein